MLTYVCDLKSHTVNICMEEVIVRKQWFEPAHTCYCIKKHVVLLLYTLVIQSVYEIKTRTCTYMLLYKNYSIKKHVVVLLYVGD
jgi:hypothetical protein